MAAEHEDHEGHEEHPPPKFAPKPAVPHMYGKTGIAFGVFVKERMPPNAS